MNWRWQTTMIGSVCAVLLACPARGGVSGGKIVCFGDTMSYAGGSQQAWVHQLAAKASGATAVNESSRHRKTRCVDDLNKVLEKHQDAATIIIMLGVNDMKKGHRQTPELCKRNIGELVDAIRDSGSSAQVVICAPPVVNASRLTDIWKRKMGMSPNAPEYMKLFVEKYREVAGEKGVGFIDVSSAVSPENMYDGVNISEKGRKQIADTVYSGLTSSNLVPPKPAPRPVAAKKKRVSPTRARARKETTLTIVIIVAGVIVIGFCVLAAVFKHR
jgi:lysophospholipase L1-like esterase